jgi:hypothetical protein
LIHYSTKSEEIIVKKLLVEFSFNEKLVRQHALKKHIKESVNSLDILVCTTRRPTTIKFYKNIPELTVDSASKQCLKCPAYFTQERSE